MDRHNNTSSSVEPAPLEWFLNISCRLWTSVFIALFFSEPKKVNWLGTVGKRFNWQVIMGCDHSNKEAQSRSRPRADRTRWLMSDRFLNSIQQQWSTAWTGYVVCETMQDFLTVISVPYKAFGAHFHRCLCVVVCSGTLQYFALSSLAEPGLKKITSMNRNDTVWIKTEYKYWMEEKFLIIMELNTDLVNSFWWSHRSNMCVSISITTL